MKKNIADNYFFQYIILFISSILNAISISLLLDPNKLAPGGVTGIAIIINYLYHIPTGTMIILLNIPIMILGIWKFGIKFFISTIFTIISSSIFVNLLADMEPLTEDLMLAAVAGGSLLALSIGIIFKLGATTGGIDVVVKLIRLKYKHIKIGRIFLTIDSVVVIISAIAFNEITIGMYAGIAVVVSSFVLDFVLYGGDDAKLIYIISEREDRIVKRLMEEVVVGVTYLDGTGAYSKKEKDIIMCVSKKQLFPKVQQIVHEEDENAFMIVTSANEVFGEGFKNYKGLQL